MASFLAVASFRLAGSIERTSMSGCVASLSNTCKPVVPASPSMKTVFFAWSAAARAVWREAARGVWRVGATRAEAAAARRRSWRGMAERRALAGLCCMAWREADNSLGALVLQLLLPCGSGELEIRLLSSVLQVASPQNIITPQLLLTLRHRLISWVAQ